MGLGLRALNNWLPDAGAASFHQRIISMPEERLGFSLWSFLGEETWGMTVPGGMVIRYGTDAMVFVPVPCGSAGEWLDELAVDTHRNF